MELPGTISFIPHGLFLNCSGLETVTIPASVTQMDGGVFQGCFSLKTINCLAKEAPIVDGGFCEDEIYDQVDLNIPEDAVGYDQGEWARFMKNNSNVCELSDNAPTIKVGTYKAGNLSYTRKNLKSGNYATFCLPFDINFSDVVGNLGRVYTTSGTSLYKTTDGMLILMLKEITSESNIPAGQPFFTQIGENTTEITFKNNKAFTAETENFVNPDPVPLQVFDWDGQSGLLKENVDVKVSFGGTVSTISGVGSEYKAFKTNGSFAETSEGIIKAFRAYVIKDLGVTQHMIKKISIGVEHDGNITTVGDNLKELNSKKTSVYTLDGRLVNTTGSLKGLPSGVYIQNNKKVLVK